MGLDHNTGRHEEAVLSLEKRVEILSTLTRACKDEPVSLPGRSPECVQVSQDTSTGGTTVQYLYDGAVSAVFSYDRNGVFLPDGNQVGCAAQKIAEDIGDRLLNEAASSLTEFGGQSTAVVPSASPEVEVYRDRHLAYHLDPQIEAAQLAKVLFPSHTGAEQCDLLGICDELLRAMRAAETPNDATHLAHRRKLHLESLIFEEEVADALTKLSSFSPVYPEFQFLWPEMAAILSGDTKTGIWLGASAYPHVVFRYRPEEGGDDCCVHIGPSPREKGSFMVVMSKPDS